MSNKKTEFGIVYVLTNPVMPGLVKIGMTTIEDVDKRMKELYTTGVPVPFECKFACRVKKTDCAKIEKALHKAFSPDRINANREFFRIQVEQVVAILELFHHEVVTESVSDEIENDLTPDDKAAKDKAKHRSPFNFAQMGLNIGDIIVYKNNPEITAEVYSERSVLYKGKEMTLTNVTKEIKGTKTHLAPLPNWLFNDRLLSDIYDETYPIDD